MSYIIGDFPQNERCRGCAAPLRWYPKEEPEPGDDMVHMFADCGFCGDMYETWAPITWKACEHEHSFFEEVYQEWRCAYCGAVLDPDDMPEMVEMPDYEDPESDPYYFEDED